MIIRGTKRDVYILLWCAKYNQLLSTLPKDLIRYISFLLYFSRKLQVGDIIDVLDTVKIWYPCYIMQTNWERREIFIHYYGWSDRWDEWIPLTSSRLAPLWTQKHKYGRPAYSTSKTCKICISMEPLMKGNIEPKPQASDV